MRQREASVIAREMVLLLQSLSCVVQTITDNINVLG